MKNAFPSTLLVVAVALFAGCSSPTGRRAAVGGGAGAAAGALIGGGGGALVGGLFGAAIGARSGYELEKRDRAEAVAVLEGTPSNQSREWTNPDTGTQYRMTPKESFESQAGEPCREFLLEGRAGGEEEEIEATACRQDDGSWRVVSSETV